VIDHDVVRRHGSVHDPFAVAEIQGLEQLEYVVSDIMLDKPGVKGAEVGVVDIFGDEAGRFTLAVPDHVQE
jgi:hypothetical protein